MILYTTGCPKCKVLEQKLNAKNIAYDIVTDVDKMMNLGIQSAPALQVEDTIYNFADAIKYVNERL